MALNSEKVGRLLKMIQQTQEVELTCPECLDDLDKYTKAFSMACRSTALTGSEHLDACSCCSGQFTLVLETLKAIEES